MQTQLKIAGDRQWIERIAVIGAGLMGHGIAQEFALAGYQVRIHDLSDDRLETALANIRANLQRLSAMGRVEHARIDPAMAEISASTELEKTVSGAELVIESIVEEIGAKHALFRSLDELCGRDTLIASNTSSFMPSRLAEAVSRKDRLLVAHYFNPPYLIPLVEIVPGPETSSEALAAMVGLLKSVGKEPVVLRKEATGFVGNRLQFALFREALAIVDQGIANPEDLDRVVRFGFGRRLAAAGPFEVFDLAGLHTIAAVAAEIVPVLSTATPSGQQLPELLRQKIQRGELGVKSGRGFHDWTEEKIEELRNRLIQGLVRAATSE
jgi:3-hydroxybutyryl-CoA dehydrogenase